MAESNLPFNPSLADDPNAGYEFNTRTALREPVDRLKTFQDLGLDLGDRNTLTDSGVNILDTLQTLGNIPLSVLPNYELQDSVENSQTLDEFRSPAYLAAQKLRALSTDPNADFLESAGNAVIDTLSSDNLVADAAAQIPYLMMGPASRAAGIARADKVTGVMGKIAKHTLGTSDVALANRIAALSGGIEAASAYAQTYERALNQTGDPAIAEEQAQQAAGVNAILGAALARLTPGFEMNPTGRGIRGNIGTHLSAIAGEAIVEEGGLAIAQTVTDNVLAGKDDLLEGAGAAFGEAAAIGGVFTGAIRAPRAVIETSRDIGAGVMKGLKILGDRATTPEAAATAAADVANQPQATPPQAEPAQAESAVDAEVLAKGEEIRQNVDLNSPDIPTVYPVAPEDIPTLQPAPESEQDKPVVPVEENIPTLQPVEDIPDVPVKPDQVDTSSRSEMTRAVLVDAATDAVIQNTTDAEQAAAIIRKEELAPIVKKAQETIEKIPDARVAEIVELAEKGNHEASQLVKAIQRTDATKLPEKAIPKKLRPAVKKLKELKELKLDKTSAEILEEGFNSAPDSRGVLGYMQGVINNAALGIIGPNETASELERFNEHLQTRAAAFREAMGKPENKVKVEGTRTRTERGGLQDKPFIIHKLNPNSMKTVERVFQDAARSQEVVDTLRASFPKMFAIPVSNPVTEATTAEETRAATPVEKAAAEVSVPQVTEIKDAPVPLAREAQPAATPPASDNLTLEETPEFNRAAALQDLETNGDEPLAQRVGMPPAVQVTAPDSEGYIAYIPGVDNSRQIVSAFVPPAGRGKGYGKANLLHLAQETKEAGQTLNSDISVSAAQLRVYETLKAEGKLTFEYSDKEAAATALREGSKLTGQQPAIINIRPTDPIGSRIEFAQFNGINRFESAFTPNGTGLLANSYGDMVAAMEIGSEDEKKAAAILNKVVPKFVTEINNYVQKVLNSPISKGDNTKLKDALDTHKALPEYTNYVWVHLLTKTADGYALHPAVAQSAAVSALMQMTRGAFQRSQFTPDDADESTDGMYYQWLQNVSRDSQRILGVHENKNESLTLTDGIPKSLAATVLEVLRLNGDVDINSIQSDGKTLKNITLNPGVAKVLRDFPAFPEVMRRVFGAAEDDTIHYGAPPKDVKPVYRHSRTPITAEQRIALKNRQNVTHNRNTGFYKLLGALGDNYSKLITGFDGISKDAQLNELSRSLVTGVHGELNAVVQYNAGVELYAREHNMAPEDVPVHFSYEILRNGRSFSGYSPQTKKTLREFLPIKMKTMDLTNPAHVKVLKLAIAQSIGIKTDVNTHEQIIAELDAKIPEITDRALAVYLASQGEEVPELFQLLDRDKLYEPKELHGLMILGKFLANQGDTAFQNTLAFEIDGKTNGPFMAELLFGLHTIDKKTQMNLEQGGLFLNDSTATLATAQDYLRTEYKSADLYERVARNAEALKNPILMLAGFTDKAGAISRTAAKEAVTPLVYGSGIGSLSAVFTMRINNGLIDRLRLAIKHGDTALASKLRGMINSAEVALLGEELAESLGKSYADEKPQVTLTNNLMVAATTLHVGIRKAMFEAKVKADLEGQREAGLLPKQYDLSRNSYDEILASLPSTGIFVPNMGTVVVGENANTGRSNTRVEGAGKVNSVQISKPEVQMPGVSVLALLTQAAGDAAMGNYLFQDAENVLDVYDGIEMDPLEIDSMGVKLNDAVWQSSSDSLLDEFVPMLEWVLKHQDFMDNPDNAKTLQRLRQRFNTNNNVDAVKALHQAIHETSTRIKAGRARLNSKPRALNQMSGGGVPYTTDVGVPVRSETVIGDFREGWDNTIEAGFDANNGKLDAEGIRTLLDGHKWKNKTHAAMWQKVRNLLPEGLLVSLAKNETEWNDLSPVGETGIVYGSVRGTSYADTGKINLATASAETILHELVHQNITGVINQYFANINAVPVDMRAPVNDLHQLMKRFLQMKGDETMTAVQGFIRDLDAKGDTAAAVDEMTAFVLTNEELINQLQPTFLQRVVARIKALISLLFGTTATEPFMNEVLNAFGRLAGGPNMDANKAVRTSPVLDKTTAAFATIARKVARGQIKGVPKVKDSGLAQIRTTINLSPEQMALYQRVWMLLRIDNRSGALEKYATTVLNHHPQAAMFNGVIDAVASLMALTAVDPTFRAQADAIWTRNSAQPYSAENLVDTALHTAPLTDGASILNEALDAMRAEGEYNLSFLGTATQRLDRMANEWMEKIGEKAAVASQTAPSGAQQLLMGVSALTSEAGAEAFGKTLLRAVNEFTNQRWLQDGVATLVGSQDDTNTVYRQVNSMKANIAQTRSLFTTYLPAQLKTLFPEGFDGWNHLFNHVGRLDAGVLGASAGQMYADDTARAKAIAALESKVANSWDARNLAHYLVHGSIEPNSPHALLRNARAIADNLNGKKRKAPESLVADVDQLVTLYAIDKLTVNERARVAGYFASHGRSMESIIGMLQKVAAEEANQYQDAYRYSYWKGALPLSTDPRTSIVVAGGVRGALLEKLGYKKTKRFQVATNDPASDLFYYVRDNAPPPVFTQGVISTVQQTSQGVNYTTAATISPEVGTLVTNPRLVSYIRNNQGRNSNMVPIFNYDGDIVGYERLLDRKTVQEATKSNNTLLHIAIGQKLGRIVEERMANRFNKEAIDILKKQWDAGVAANEQAQYEAVNSSTDKQIARAWEVVPAETKKALEDAFGGPVMIRKDLVANTLGYHKAGVMDIYTGNASLSEETRRAFYGLAETLMGPNSAKYLFIAEQAIKEGVATAKDWIVVRSLTVAISNAIASMNLVIANGVPLKELVSSYREGMRDLRTYGRLQKDIIGLTVKIAGASPTEAAKLKTIQKAKYESIRRLAIYPLIEAGELSDLPEGLEESPKHSYLGDFSGWLNNHLRHLHPKLPMVAANAIIAKDTAFHDAVSKAIQAGDFLGKWAVYKHMVKSGKGIEAARDTVRDEFISYGTNPGRFRGALEDFGLVWWSQFTLRAQKVLLRRFRKNPFSFFVAAGAGEVTGADAPSDAQLFERGWDNSTGLDNVINAPSAHIWAKVF
jgi:predicted GNAT family acetyltransferase